MLAVAEFCNCVWWCLRRGESGEPTMSEFEDVLRGRVSTVRAELAAAWQAGDHYWAELHGARLEQLLDLAARNDVDLDVEIPPQGRG